MPSIPTPVPIRAPVADLLGDDDGFTPYAEATNIHTATDDVFGHFQEATPIPSKQVTSPTSMYVTFFLYF
jgi:hypothetical protein